jgi:leucyl-tRNA synthetase
MFLGPFQEGGDFRDEGIVGIRRFLERLWAMAYQTSDTASVTAEATSKLHQTIRKVSSDTESLQYNTAIAAMMEYVNVLKQQDAARKDQLTPLIVMLAPYAPHIAEELWEALGGKGSVFEQCWPSFDERLASAGDVEIAVQVNGKLRSRLVVPRGMAESEVLKIVLSDAAVKKFVNGQPVKKVIYVQDRLVNLVV